MFHFQFFKQSHVEPLDFSNNGMLHPYIFRECHVSVLDFQQLPVSYLTNEDFQQLLLNIANCS